MDSPRKDAARQPFSTRLRRWLWKNQIGWIVVAAVVLVLVLKFRQQEGTTTAKAATQVPTAASTTQQAQPTAPSTNSNVVATVNGQDITREQLSQACIQRHGEGILESLVNRRLILHHCEKRAIAVTNEEISAEIDRMAKRFQLSREQWLELLQRERGISAQEYARDIVWPTLALRKLAAAQIRPTEEEITLAMEREFGETVSTRLIAVGNEELAQQLHQQLESAPDRFARLAIENSIDINSASVGGLIPPIRRHMGDATIEQAAFSLQPGQISPVLPVAGQFILLQCISRNNPSNVDRAEVEQDLVEKISDEKLREASHNLFAELQNSATIVNVYNNPQLRETLPGTVATINGDRITMKELGDECLVRHGKEVLETEISHLLLEQAADKANVKITRADLDAEVEHAAELAGVTDKEGRADLDEWYKMIAKEQKLDRSVYLRDAVWPSAALKKLTAAEVQVTEEDLQKGFEANFGERVRCRAIVLPTLRRAQEVWDKARRNPSAEFFGDLAEEYSIEPSSKTLRGEIPPIQRYSGQPQLETAAFQLQEGELSGIIQVNDKFLILLCEGRTERKNMDLKDADVREILGRDIYEKKLRMAMSAKYESIRESSRIDNFLAGTSQAPSSRTAAGKQRMKEDAAVRPTSGAMR
jgi:parvulin-like peptidyl-prolyl isomerase